MFHCGRNKLNFTRDYLKDLKGLTQTLKNILNLLVELKPLFIESFQGSRMQFQCKRLVLLRIHLYVPADFYQAKQPDKSDCTLFVCIWSRHLRKYLLEEIRLDTDILEKHLLYNLNWSCFEHTVACSNITMPCCVAVVIEKSVMGESFVFCPARLDPRPDSW